MAISSRYEPIDNLPQAGIQLASLPMMRNFSEVLDTALRSSSSSIGATYNESDKRGREISYVYALNSLYRELLRWQNQYPENEQISGLRQEIREMFPYFMDKEFPLPDVPPETADFLHELADARQNTADKIQQMCDSLNQQPQLSDEDAELLEKLETISQTISAQMQENADISETFEHNDFQKNELLLRIHHLWQTDKEWRDEYYTMVAPDEDERAKWSDLAEKKHIIPSHNYEINDDCIEINSRDAQTSEIMDPQEFEIEPEALEGLNGFLEKINSFIQNQYSSWKYSVTEQRELNFQKKVMKTSQNFMRKMQYYLARKAENKRVFDFRTVSEKARTFRNTFKKQIENLTGITTETNEEFSKNTQILVNSADGLGMDMVWFQEPPYESEFITHLKDMKDELRGNTPPEFYNTKLPVFLDLCKNIYEYSPQEAAALKTGMEDFLQNPNKEKLCDLITETHKIALELRKTDYIKSRCMRYAWDGTIVEPPIKSLSQFLQNKLLVCSHLDNPNPSPDMQQKIAEHNASLHKFEEYDFEKSKVWNICRQVPQFKQFEKRLFEEIVAIGIPPEKVEKLTFNDITYLLNRSNLAYKSLGSTAGITVPSDKVKYLEDLVKNHEKELRKSLNSYYQQTFQMKLINDGVAQKKSDVKIQKKIAAEAEIATEKVLTDMKNGDCYADFNCHHVFPLSMISYFEKTTGKPFTEINKDILFVNKNVHELFHLNENMMNAEGQVLLGQYESHRTKYINRQKTLKDKSGNITGYIGRAISFIMVPKNGIKAMIDFKSYILDKETILTVFKNQQHLIELRKNSKRNRNLYMPQFNMEQITEYLMNVIKPVVEAELPPHNPELQKARELDKMNQERRYNISKVEDRTPQPQKAPVTKNLSGNMVKWYQNKNKNRKFK